MIRLMQILLVSLPISLTGCVTTSSPQCLVTTPALIPVKTVAGGITLTASDTASLLKYIEDLERCSGLY